MDYAPEACQLARNFSDGQNQVTVVFERCSSGPKLRVGLASNDIKPNLGPDLANFRFGIAGSDQQSPLFVTTLTDGRRAYLLDPVTLADLPSPKSDQSLDEADQAQDKAAAQIDTLVITHAFTRVPEFKLGSMAEPIEAMRASVDNLTKG